MTKTTKMNADDARALLQGTTPGPWSAEFTADDRLYVTQSCAPHADVACDLDACDLDARLMSAAPDLAAAVVALAAERDEALAEVERLRAIIEGRTTPPTREELEVHCSAGGSFRVAFPSGDQCTVASEHERVFTAEDHPTARWWAHDRTGRPCAWPTVTP